MPEYCVTGGTGYIASHLIKVLLEKGHTVRATVRDPENLEKVGFLWDLQGAKERLKLIKANLLEEGSFDDAVKGVNGVFHTASPVAPPPYGDNVQEILIDPAVKGTANVLKSCVNAEVKRVVLTSSSSSLRYRHDVQEISPLNESVWSDLDYCKNYKMWYAYAKTLAEKEAWKICKESEIDLMVILPSFVVGPILPPQPTSSILRLLSIIKGGIGGIPNQIMGFVHIDDVVSTHILAMEESEESGRFICTGQVAHWSEIVEILKEKYPMYPYEDKLIRGQLGDANPHSYDTSKIIELGLPGFKTISQMFDDCIISLQDKGEGVRMGAEMQMLEVRIFVSVLVVSTSIQIVFGTNSCVSLHVADLYVSQITPAFFLSLVLVLCCQLVRFIYFW
ncbi:hypothetical protein V2J09_008619 [Rumex salicifolius]